MRVITNIKFIMIKLATIIINPLIFFSKYFKKYKISLINPDRLGHLALNTDLFFRKDQLGELADDTCYYLIAPTLGSSRVSNSYLLMMFKRFTNNVNNITLITNTFTYLAARNLSKSLNSYDLLYELEYNSNEEEFSQTNQTIYFNDFEMEHGKQLLSKLGIGDINNKIVCIFARDDAYLETKKIENDWSYHDYRNADINTYIDAIMFLPQI